MFGSSKRAEVDRLRRERDEAREQIIAMRDTLARFSQEASDVVIAVARMTRAISAIAPEAKP